MNKRLLPIGIQTFREIRERECYYVDKTAPRSPEKHPARRWVVERTHTWHNRFRRLLVRWEKKSTHYEAFIHVASVLIIFRIVGRMT